MSGYFAHCAVVVKIKKQCRRFIYSVHVLLLRVAVCNLRDYPRLLLTTGFVKHGNRTSIAHGDRLSIKNAGDKA